VFGAMLGTLLQDVGYVVASAQIFMIRQKSNHAQVLTFSDLRMQSCAVRAFIIKKALFGVQS
jgi:hypothetical protein